MTTFSATLNPKRKLAHVRNGKKKRKQGERKETKRVRNAQLPSRSASLACSMLPHAGDHTGSRAIEWLTEVDRRTHTCLIEARLYVNAVCCCKYVWQRKTAGSATGIFWNSHEKPAYLNSLIFGRKQEGSTVIAKQVQVVDQTTLPPKCHSFVGLDRQIRSSPPACCFVQCRLV